MWGAHVAVDRGGTFTDVFARGVPITPEGEEEKTGERASQSRSVVIKLLSSDPDHYRDAPSEGIRRALVALGLVVSPAASGPGDDAKGASSECLVPGKPILSLRMGTTVATNALLERSGADVCLVTTERFRDLLTIGNQSRPDIFDLSAARPQGLFSSVVEVAERVRVLTVGNREAAGPATEVEGAADVHNYLVPEGPGKDVFVGTTGEQVHVLQAPDRDVVRAQLQGVFDSGVRSLAVVFLHSYTYPDHERIVGDIAREIGFEQVSLSSELAPMIKVVPRGQTAR
jgi:5-oxoprolinase (ATP-hydrolysing)